MKVSRVQIICDSETWTIEGEEDEDLELLNAIDDGLMKLIRARELLARLRD